MRKWIFVSLLLIAALLIIPGSALAQTYSFSLDKEEVDVYWHEDGSISIDYVFIFTNNASASPIDYVDVGVPNSNYDLGSVSASVDGRPVSDIEPSPYVKPGVAVGLGGNAIRPGATGRVEVFIGSVRRMLHQDSDNPDYASAVFSPTWFGSEYVYGNTDLTVTYHLPPGVQPEEPRWHKSPGSGFPSEPETGFDEEGRITYTWRNPNARGDRQYLFGASFPKTYVPAATITRPSFLESLGISVDDLIGATFCLGFTGFILFIIVASVRSTQKRKLQYLPPKVSIEGHGIKRGLTAIEAAILMEQPMDKIMTMILFSVIKKGAATVTSRDPLKVEATSPRPEGLHAYEVQFIDSFQKSNLLGQRKALQDMMIDLVKGVSQKMKGFSRRETLDYYKEIMNRAWAQVEAANTPEVKSQKFDEVMEWTMLDRKYEDRTRDVFRTGPVYVPMWWPRYDPNFGGGASGGGVKPASIPSSTPGGGGMQLPHLPGSDFAASVVGGVQNFSSSVIGNVSDFTGRITDKTNPVPVATTSRSSGRSGGGCACACACAGCACACAGGGR